VEYQDIDYLIPYIDISHTNVMVVKVLIGVIKLGSNGYFHSSF